MSRVLQSKPKLPGFFNLLLVIALGVLASKLMWLVITPKDELNLQVENIGVTTGSVKKEINYGKLIANQHLFGEIKKKATTAKAEPKKVVEPKVVAPKLNLKLHGIVAYKKNEGLALISSSNGPQKVYGEGEEIQEKVKVYKVYHDKVVLVNHGKHEDLRLPVHDKKSPNKTAASKANQNVQRTPTRKSPIASNVAAAKAKADLDLGSFRQEVMQNPGKLMDIARPSPAVINGQFIGFRVQPGAKRKLFRELGFRPNDIITEVNGILLDDPSKGSMVLGELAQASSLSIKVKRGDQEIFIEQSF